MSEKKVMEVGSSFGSCCFYLYSSGTLELHYFPRMKWTVIESCNSCEVMTFPMRRVQIGFEQECIRLDHSQRNVFVIKKYIESVEKKLLLSKVCLPGTLSGKSRGKACNCTVSS